MTDAATVVAGSSTGLVAGVYLAFWTMVMPALDRSPADAALALMQRINGFALRPVFMVVFFGAAAASAWVLVARGPADIPPAVGATLSLASFVITVVFHVPRNRRMSGLDPGSPTGVQAWRALSTGWRRGNHLRAACAAAGLVAFLW